MDGLKIFLGFALLLTVGCRSCPPPGIENGKYIFPKRQISFDVPPSPPWFQSKYLPDRFNPQSRTWVCTLGAFSDIIFVDDAHNGAIAAEVEKTWLDIGIIPPQKIEKTIREELTKNNGVRSAPFVSNYDFKLTVPYVCEIPLPILHETFTMKSQGTTYRCEIRTYIYTINQDDTCLLRFTLWSAPKTYEQNRAVLDRLVKTIQRIQSNPPAPEVRAVQ